MAKVGNVLVDVLAELEESEPRSEVTFQIKSRDFRRYMEKLDNKVDNMQDAFSSMGLKIFEVFFSHFQNNEGPDPQDNNNMIQWPAYNLNAKGESQYHKWKQKHSPNPDKLMEESGELKESLRPGGAGNIFKATSRTLEIGTEVGHYIFGHEGFQARGSGPSPEQTQRPIIGLTDDEEEKIINDWWSGFMEGDSGALDGD